MKIEFLNENLTLARITRGWFRRVYAYIIETDTIERYAEDLELGFGGYPFNVWVFQSTRRPIDYRISIKVHQKKWQIIREREDAARPAEWIRAGGKPVRETKAALPSAKVVFEDLDTRLGPRGLS